MDTPITIGGLAAPDSELARNAAALAASPFEIASQSCSQDMVVRRVHREEAANEIRPRAGLSRVATSRLATFGRACCRQALRSRWRRRCRQEPACPRLSEGKDGHRLGGHCFHSVRRNCRSQGTGSRARPLRGFVSTSSGSGSDEISSQLIDDTIALYPRLGFKKAFTQALAEVAGQKPYTAIGTGLADIGRRLVPGLNIPDVCDMLLGAPFES